MARTFFTALARRIVRSASLLVPRRDRAAWLNEWDAEIQHESRASHGLSDHFTLVQRSSGAFSDAAWLRRQFTGDAEMFHDTRHVLRMLAARPVFTIIATGVLALGIGASTAIFTVVDTLLLKTPPYPEIERIVAIWERDTAGGAERQEVSPANFLDWRDMSTSFARVASAAPWSLDYTGGPQPEIFFGTMVSDGFFDVLGLQPLHGRLFTAADHIKGREKVAILTHALWSRRFAADPRVVGTRATLDGQPYEIIGVLPAWFDLPLLAGSAKRDLFMPGVTEDYMRRQRGSGYWAVVAKLRAGVTREQAQAEMDTISDRLAKEHPKTNATVRARVDPLTEHLEANVRSALIAMLAAVAVVLLIACGNVANLMLARGVEREREFAIRGALGAGRGRLIRQLLTESLVISFAATALGLTLAWWLLRAIVATAPPQVQRIDQVAMDWRVLLFSCGLGVATAVCFGLLPALQFSKATARDAVKEGRAATGTRRARGLRDGLAVAEIALAMILVVGAGLLLRSFQALVRVDTGFAAEHVAAVQVFAYDRTARTKDGRVQFFKQSVDRMRALPGVTNAGAVSAMPFIAANINIEAPLTVEGRAPLGTEPPPVYLTTATDGYFETMGIPVLRGRTFTSADDARGAPVAMVSASLAARHFGNDDPVGRFVSVPFGGRQNRVQIVGVVSELRHDALDQPPREEIFLSQAQIGFGSMTYVIRTAGDPSQVIDAAKQVVWSLDPMQTIYDEATVPQLLAASVAPRRFAMTLVGVFAAIALVLAAAGVYGVMSFTTSLRTREIGVRLALGASSRTVALLVVGRSVALGSLGIAIGLAGSLAVGRGIRTMLYEVSPFDPVTFAAVAALLLAVSAAAAYVPARRASRVDPLTALRAE